MRKDLRLEEVHTEAQRAQRLEELLEKVPGFSFLVLGWLEDLILGKFAQRHKGTED